MQSKILIVDDELDLLEANAACFKSSDFEVKTASNGFEALKYLAIEKFDAILTDYNMPNMDGIQFTNYVKVNELNNKTPIFVISGQIHEHAVELLKKIGIKAFITKPYDILKVVTIIKSKISPPTKHEHYSLEMSDLLVKTTIETFKQYFDDVRIVENTISYSSSQLGNFSSTLAIYGQYCFGYNSLYCNYDILTEVCKKMFGDQGSDYGDTFMVDLTGELNNSLSGNLKLNLAEHQEMVQIGLPISMKGHPQALALLPSTPRNILKVSVGNSHCFVEYCFGDPVRIATVEKKHRLEIFKKKESKFEIKETI